MKFQEYVSNLNKLLKDRPETSDFDVYMADYRDRLQERGIK